MAGHRTAMTKGNATEPGRKKGVSGVAAAGWRGGWWTGAVFGSVWLAVIGVHSSRSPAVMADGMTLSAFSLPSIMRGCVCMSKWRHTHLGGKQLVTETLTMSIGAGWVGSQGVTVTISGCSISFDHIILCLHYLKLWCIPGNLCL